MIVEKNLIIADEGKTFIRKADNFDMGNMLSLGVNPLSEEGELDSIDNYLEVEIPKEVE